MPTWYGFLFRLSPGSGIDGIDVRVWLTDEAERAAGDAKIRDALSLIARHRPKQFQGIHDDLRGILVTALPAVAQYSRSSRLCLLDHEHLGLEDVSPLLLAGVLVHEATHARLHRLGFTVQTLNDVIRHEHICLSAELLLGIKDSRKRRPCHSRDGSSFMAS